MNWIVNKQVAVGSQEEACNDELLKQEKIDIIVDVRPLFHSEILIPTMFEMVAKTISQILEGGKRVMVHCYSGIDRSPFFCAVYLHFTEHMLLTNTYDRVKRLHPQTFVHWEWVNEFNKEETRILFL